MRARCRLIRLRLSFLESHVRIFINHYLKRIEIIFSIMFHLISIIRGHNFGSWYKR